MKEESKRLRVFDFFERNISLAELIKEANLLGSTRKKGIHENNSDINKMIQDKWKPKEFGIEDLMLMPPNTLGRVTSLYLLDITKDQETIHLVPSSIRFKISYPINKKELVSLRMKQTHDYIHVLTNIDTSQLGEIALQAFYLAQKASFLSLIAILRELAEYVSKSGDKLYLEAILDGMNIGLDAKENCSFYRFEEELDISIIELRKKLNIRKSEKKTWSYKF